MFKKLLRSTAIAGAALAVAASGLLYTADAQAADTCSLGSFCLYYSTNQKDAVSGFVTSVDTYLTPTGPYKFTGSGAGKGKAVDNNAASAWNRTARDVVVYADPSMKGDAQIIAPGAKVNLNTKLAKKNSSHKFLAPAPSKLALSGGMTIPNPLMSGMPVKVKGTVTSNHLITKVSGQILNTATGKAVYSASAAPNATSYNMAGMDSALSFGKLPSGSYRYAVTATDLSGTTKTLVSTAFTVKIPVNPADYVCPIKASFPSVTGASRYFGASRDGGTRAHAGIDFTGPAGTAVYAATGGKVTAYSYFYEGTYALEVKNNDGTVIRYGEITSNLRPGDKVTKGQKIGTTKKNKDGTAMLHLEFYKGTASGPLSDKPNRTYTELTSAQKGKNYERRSDLMDPTFFANLPKG